MKGPSTPNIQRRRPHSRRAPSLFLAAMAFLGLLAPLKVRAQEPFILNQRLNLLYNQWRIGQSDTLSSEQISYGFTLGMPLVVYRLGAVALSGSLDYNSFNIGDRSSNDFGLNRYGARITLFPYRRFHVSLSYNHVQSPAFFGTERVRSDVYGVDLSLRYRHLPSITIGLQRGFISQGSEKENWTQWTLGGHDRLGATRYTFNVYRQEFENPLPGSNWTYNAANLGTRTTLSKRWTLLTSFLRQQSLGGVTGSGSGTLLGSFGPWGLVSLVSYQDQSLPYSDMRLALASQSVTYHQARWTWFSTASMIDQTVESPTFDTGDSRSGTFSLGTIYELTPRWKLHGDLSLSRRTGTALANAADTSHTYHIGLARGGDIPDVLRHTLFYFSELQFSRRVEEDYPPGYLPPALQNEMRLRRVQQEGALGMALDYWRSETSDSGTRDWLRGTGTLQVNHGLRALLIADWKRDRGFDRDWDNRDSTNVSLNAVYRFGKSSVSTTVGYSSISASTPPAPLSPVHNSQASTYYAASFNSQFKGNPWGLILTRYESDLGSPVTTLSAYSGIHFGRVNLRLNYDVSRQNGFNTYRVSINLLRLFDSIMLFGGERRPW